MTFSASSRSKSVINIAEKVLISEMEQLVEGELICFGYWGCLSEWWQDQIYSGHSNVPFL